MPKDRNAPAAVVCGTGRGLQAPPTIAQLSRPVHCIEVALDGALERVGLTVAELGLVRRIAVPGAAGCRLGADDTAHAVALIVRGLPIALGPEDAKGRRLACLTGPVCEVGDGA